MSGSGSHDDHDDHDHDDHAGHGHGHGLDESVSLRVIAIFVILVSSFIGVALPALVHYCAGKASKKPTGAEPNQPGGQEEDGHNHDCEDDGHDHSGISYRHIIKLLSAIGCGCIVATGLCHIAPPASENLTKAFGESEAESGHEGHEEHGGGHSHGFPHAFAIATGSIFILYIIEHELSTLLLGSRKPEAATGKPKSPKQVDGEMTAVAPVAAQPNDSASDVSISVDSEEAATRTRNGLVAHILELGVAVHSVLIGVALGLLSEPEEARPLLIALCFHQLTEGAAIGASVLESNLSRCHTALMWAIFCVTTPIGVAIGLIVERTRGEGETRDSLISQGVLESIALGILLYMALVDMLPSAFNLRGCGQHNHGGGGGKHSDAPPPFWFRILLYLCLLVGAGIMILLAQWA